jgi:hypothetical protein
MPKLTAIAVVLLSASSALAQESSTSLRAALFSTTPVLARIDESNDVPHRGRLIEHHGFYAAPTFGVTSLDGGVAPLVGVRAAWLANHTIGVGVAFNALANKVDEKLDQRGRALGGYGGLLVSHVFGQGHAVHGSVDATVGAGAACRQTGSANGDDCLGKSFFVFEPMASLEVDVVRAFRLSFGAGYRLAIAGESGSLSSADLSGFVGKAALEFGSF